MKNSKLQIISFYVLLAAVGLVIFLMWFPFFKLIALSVILTVLFLPMHKKIVSRIKSQTLGSVISLSVILLTVIIPAYVVGQLVFNEIYHFYLTYSNGGVVINPSDIVRHLPSQLQPFFETLNHDLSQRFSALATSVYSQATNLISGVATFMLSFFLVFFTLYYLLRDREKIKIYFSQIFPLSEEHENLLIKKLEDAVSGVVKGSFLVALIQGSIGTIGYLIFGLPQPFLWGMFTVLAALVPNVGTFLAWAPAVLYLFITGHSGAALGMLLWSIFLTGTIDNLVSPRLIGGRVQMHPLLVLVSVLGGLQLFGFIGFLLGPILMAVFMALLDIYRTDLKEYSEK